MQHHISTTKVYEKDLTMGINEIITPLKELCHVLVIYIERGNKAFQSEKLGKWCGQILAKNT